MNKSSIILKSLVIISAVITAVVILTLIIYIIVKGIGYIDLGLFSINYDSNNLSMMPSLISTFMIIIISLIISLPIGIGTAIYLTEYAQKESRIVSIINLSTDTLQAIPSIVYGLFGMLMFVTFLGFGYSLIAGCLTISIMILPLIIRSTQEALLNVPSEYKEGSFGLGAGKLRTIFKVILPSAGNGILAGIILAIGRIIGESAALIFTAGTIAQIPNSLFDSSRSVAVHMYVLSSEGLHMDKASATAVLLLIFILIINTLTAFISKRIFKTKG